MIFLSTGTALREKLSLKNRCIDLSDSGPNLMVEDAFDNLQVSMKMARDYEKNRRAKLAEAFLKAVRPLG